MIKFNVLTRLCWTFLVTLTLTLGLAGCDGDDGAAGATGAAGSDGSDGSDGLACWDLNGNGTGDPDEDINSDGLFNAEDCGAGGDAVAAAVEAAKIESCGTCHDGIGEGHQALYDKYVDASAFEMTFTSFTTVAGAVAGTFDGTLELTILKNGTPFTDYVGLNEATFIVVDYDSVTDQHSSGRQYLDDSVTMVAPGDYVLTGAGLSFDPTVNGMVYGYIAQTPLYTKTGETGGEIPTGSHVELFDDVANAALAFGDSQAGDPDAYASLANVDGCEKCHGEPYLKHGFRAAQVAGLPDFAACKTCHYAGRNGFLSSLQWMVDDPLGWATGAAQTADYTYEGSIMNDTHMSHAMEFPYPQSIANCSTCHAGKLVDVLDNSNFTAETCKSCHAIQGIDAWPGETYYQGNRAPAFEYLWQRDLDLTFHDVEAFPDCTGCHGAGIARSFNEYHTGYDPTIYDATGTKYADLNTVSIDQITRSDNLLTINFSASDPAIVPEVLVSFYGWDSKNFIVPSHARDANAAACPSPWGAGCQMEYVPESSCPVGDDCSNPLFTEDPASGPGAWMVTLDMAAFQPVGTDPDHILALDIPTLIATGKVKKAEITITPVFEVGGTRVVLSAVDQTFDLGGNVVVPEYFKGGKSTVQIDKCNACHDALASTFHSQTGRAGDGIEVCKNCHNPTYPGSHIEMASRSIDSYVHAIHSFQDFDVGGSRGKFANFDPVVAKRYDQHINHVFPNFTIRNCEACHREGTYNAPNQAESMPGVLSASDDVATWYDLTDPSVEDPSGRNIGSIPEYVTGPASRACGGCHRARLVRDDAAGDLLSLNAHTESFGTYVENDTADDQGTSVDDEFLFGIIDKIMSMFE